MSGSARTSSRMTLPPLSYKRHRFPPRIIAHAVRLYFRFPLSLRLVEDLLLERGIVVSYETTRRWALKFGADYARRLKRKAPKWRTTLALVELRKHGGFGDYFATVGVM